MFEDGAAYRVLVITGEALPSIPNALGEGLFKGCPRQLRSKVADEPVVVMKFWPVKAGNSVEGKTRTTAGGGSAGL